MERDGREPFFCRIIGQEAKQDGWWRPTAAVMNKGKDGEGCSGNGNAQRNKWNEWTWMVGGDWTGLNGEGPEVAWVTQQQLQNTIKSKHRSQLIGRIRRMEFIHSFTHSVWSLNLLRGEEQLKLVENGMRQGEGNKFNRTSSNCRAHHRAHVRLSDRIIKKNKMKNNKKAVWKFSKDTLFLIFFRINFFHFFLIIHFLHKIARLCVGKNQT